MDLLPQYTLFVKSFFLLLI